MLSKYLLLFPVLLASHASAAVFLSFSKSDATTLVITVTTDVVYDVTVAGSSNNLLIKAVNPAGASMVGLASSTVEIADEDGPTISLNGVYFAGSPAQGDAGVSDLLLTSLQALVFELGETVTLSAGTITLPNYTAEAPADGDYETYWLNPSPKTYMSTEGQAVPEPSFAWIAGLGATAFLRRRRG